MQTPRSAMSLPKQWLKSMPSAQNRKLQISRGRGSSQRQLPNIIVRSPSLRRTSKISTILGFRRSRHTLPGSIKSLSGKPSMTRREANGQCSALQDQLDDLGVRVESREMNVHAVAAGVAAEPTPKPFAFEAMKAERQSKLRTAFDNPSQHDIGRFQDARSDGGKRSEARRMRISPRSRCRQLLRQKKRQALQSVRTNLGNQRSK